MFRKTLQRRFAVNLFVDYKTLPDFHQHQVNYSFKATECSESGSFNQSVSLQWTSCGSPVAFCDRWLLIRYCGCNLVWCVFRWRIRQQAVSRFPRWRWSWAGSLWTPYWTDWDASETSCLWSLGNRDWHQTADWLVGIMTSQWTFAMDGSVVWMFGLKLTWRCSCWFNETDDCFLLKVCRIH